MPSTMPVLNNKALGDGWLNNRVNRTKTQISKWPENRAGLIEHPAVNNPDNTTIVIAGT